MRHLPALLLALVLAVSMAGQGAVRLAATGSTVVLCTGDGAVTVTLGPDGKPVAGHPHCPDCLPMAALGAPAAVPPEPPTRHAHRIATAPFTTATIAHVPRHPPARAPPTGPVA